MNPAAQKGLDTLKATNPNLAERAKAAVTADPNQVRANSGISLNASDLTNPPSSLKLPPVQQPEQPSSFVQRTAGSALDNLQADITAAQKEDQQRLQQAQNDYTALLGQETPSYQSQITSVLDQFGTPDAFKQYRDTVSQLSDLNTQFDVQNTQIEQGNSIGQAQREVTQNDKERAVRTAGLRAKAELLRGNIETAMQVAKDATNFAFQDRTIRLNALQNQLTAARNQANTTDQRKYDAQLLRVKEEQQKLQEIKDAVSTAIASGGASQTEIAQLTDPNTTDDQKYALAQSITGRTAASDRSLQRQKILSTMSGGGGGTQAVSIPTYDEWKAQNGYDKQSLTPDAEAALRTQYDQLAQNAVVQTLSPLAQGIFKNPSLFNQLTASDKAKAIPELVAAGFKFPRKLSSEQEKAVNIADSGLFALQQLEDQITNDNGQLDVSVLQSFNPFSQFSTLRRGVIDALSRLQSGAALTEDEVKFYTNQTPGAFDPVDTINTKRTQLAVLFSGISGNTIVLQAPDGSAYTYDNMFDPNVRKDVRDAIKNGYTLIDY